MAAALFLANFAPGVAVQTGLVDTKPFRWLHHTLIFLVFVSAAVATLVGFVYGAPYRWPLLAGLVLFAVLPHVRAGSFGHMVLACCTLIFYALGFFQVL